MYSFPRLVFLASACALLSPAQSAAPEQTSARMVVTVGHLFTREAPLLTADNIKVNEDFRTLEVKRVKPLRAERMEIFLLVDNCSNCEPGSTYSDLEKFIHAQAPDTSIGVAYIRNGQLQIAQNPTPDRALTMKVLSPPSGSKPSSPFVALGDLIRNWSPGAARRAVIMISNGVDPGAREERQNPSAEAAIRQAQLAGVTVYAIYHPSADYTNSDFSTLYAGQVQLAHVADETGGEAYFLGFGPLPAVAPFLTDIADHLTNEYEIEFLDTTSSPAGELREVSVRCALPDVDLMAPAKVWIAGSDTSTEK